MTKTSAQGPFRNDAVAAAIAAAGSQSELAMRMTAAGARCVQQTISKMLNGELHVSVEYAAAMEKACGIAGLGRCLRPDFPWPTPGARRRQPETAAP